MDAVTHPPLPVNEPVLDYAPGSAERAALTAALAAVTEPVELGAVIGGVHRRPSGEPFQRGRARSTTGGSWRPPRTPPRPTPPTAIQAALDAAAGLAGAGLRLPGGDPAARRRTAGRSVAGQDERRDDARPGQDGLPGGDRLGLRAGRLLAVQRAFRPADPARAADRQLARASGTAPTTGRWRASSTRSPRSTSPPSPATCRPRRR